MGYAWAAVHGPDHIFSFSLVVTFKYYSDRYYIAQGAQERNIMTTNEITGFEARYNEWCDVALPATVADVLEEDNNGYTMRAIETITKYAVELETLKNEEVESYNEW